VVRQLPEITVVFDTMHMLVGIGVVGEFGEWSRVRVA